MLRYCLWVNIICWGVLPAVEAGEISRVRQLMGTFCEMTVDSPWSVEIAAPLIGSSFNEIDRLEGLLSTYQVSSEVSTLNSHASQSPQPCSPDVFELMRLSIFLSSQTKGAFDVSVGPLMDYWKLGPPSTHLFQNLSEALMNVGFQSVSLEPKARTLSFQRPHMKLDFGAIGKGFALDKALNILRAADVSRALINFGGQISAYSENPDRPWEVQIADPSQPNKIIATLKLISGSVSTSSQIEQKKTKQGKRRGHILDPRTGRPIQFKGSVTVVGPESAWVDALSTALAVLGPEEGLQLLETTFPGYEAVYLIPRKSGWTQKTTKNFGQYIQ
ncbi:MAG: FAD:protein FMN transferase [Elusimicrobia bacterium]|nr:FAD:protein FMN transferase [Elusimicrobiota bacterium]